MRLNQIRDFVAVIDCGSINGAARALAVSQPGITKSIKALEKDLQVQLVQRTTRGVVPTAYGRAFYLRARVAQSELRRGAQEIEQLAGGHGGGTVAFGTGPIAAAMIVPEAVNAFHRQFPQADVRVVEGFPQGLMPRVRDETLDFLIGPRFPNQRLESGISFRPLFQHQLVVACREGHPLASARSLAKLVEPPWLCFQPRELLDEVFSGRGLPLPRPVIQCESHSAFLKLLASSDMLGIVPRRILAEDGIRGTLREIRVTEVLRADIVGMFARSDTPLTRLAQAMAKALAKAGRQLAFSR
jgi:LysR family transcriptional regulator, regulator of abg operon